MIRRVVNRIARLCKAIAPHHRSKSMAEKRDSPASGGRSSEAEQREKQGAVELPPNDHRRIGRDQELFFFHHLSPGSAFWFPRGAHIYNKLVDFIKEQYRQRGFQEVITPNIYNSRLWEKSGHWQHYADNIFRFDVDKETYGLKPMNCPGHCLMFDQIPRAYNKLPMRLADFGVLHRDESSGALCGLVRVRRFQQDDAHIFCRPDQIAEEIKGMVDNSGCLDFLDFCYCKVFGFSFELLLSTRPDTGSLGEKEAWDDAESQLKQALDNCGREWKLNPGDGAFYGPKIDITIRDALKRLHQCATIQLDFQLPQRFDLVYFDPNKDKKRPVMIHRAVLGSVERMVAILAENFDGKWPFWLSPRQAAIITVHKSLDDYAKSVYSKLHEAGFEAEFDEDSNETLKKRIRNAQLEKFNFILVIGRAEEKNRTVNLRTRDNEIRGEVTVDDLISKFRRFRDERVLNSETAEAWSSG